jgi:hypothetical protein
MILAMEIFTLSYVKIKYGKKRYCVEEDLATSGLLTGVGVPPRLLIGVVPRDLDPDLSRLARKFRALRASLCNSLARLELGLEGVPGLSKGESGGTGLFFTFATLVSKIFKLSVSCVLDDITG